MSDNCHIITIVGPDPPILFGQMRDIVWARKKMSRSTIAIHSRLYESAAIFNGWCDVRYMLFVVGEDALTVVVSAIAKFRTASVPVMWSLYRMA